MCLLYIYILYICIFVCLFYLCLCMSILSMCVVYMYVLYMQLPSRRVRLSLSFTELSKNRSIDRHPLLCTETIPVSALPAFLPVREASWVSSVGVARKFEGPQNRSLRLVGFPYGLTWVRAGPKSPTNVWVWGPLGSRRNFSSLTQCSPSVVNVSADSARQTGSRLDDPRWSDRLSRVHLHGLNLPKVSAGF